MLMLKIIGLCVTVGFINIASRRTPSDKKQIVRALDFIERVINILFLLSFYLN